MILKEKEKISLLKKSLERDNTNLLEQEITIINNAKLEARNILLDAKEEANDIISKMNTISSNSELNNLRNKLNSDIKNISLISDPNTIISKSTNSLDRNIIKPNLHVFVNTLGQEGIVLSNISKSDEVQVQIGSIKMNINIKYLEKSKNTKNLISSTQSYTNISKTRTAKSEINIIGLNVDEAVWIVDKFLDDSSLSKLQTVRIVHGKGTGKLREGIHKFLKTNPHVKTFRLGTFGEGEMGVTIVELK